MPNLAINSRSMSVKEYSGSESRDIDTPLSIASLLFLVAYRWHLRQIGRKKLVMISQNPVRKYLWCISWALPVQQGNFAMQVLLCCMYSLERMLYMALRVFCWGLTWLICWCFFCCGFVFPAISSWDQNVFFNPFNSYTPLLILDTVREIFVSFIVTVSPIFIVCVAM